MKFVLLSSWVALALSTPLASATTVMNGDFDAPFVGDGAVNGNHFDNMPGGTGRTSWDVWTELPGWNTSSGPGIEIQTDRTIGAIDAHSGNYYVELASHGASNSNSTMLQEIVLGSGDYVFNFFYAPRTRTLGQNSIDFGITGLFDGFVDGPDGSAPHGTWTEVRKKFTVAVAGTYSVFFAATGSDTRRGGLIDTVSVSSVPLPAASLLLLAGIGGIGLMHRRKG